MNSLQSLERPTYCRGKPTNIPCTKMSWCKQDQLEEGVRLLELAQRAHRLFQKQEPREKRRLLNFLLSNCSWKGGELTAVFRQPFDMLADANVARSEWAGQDASTQPVYENWLPGLDSN